MGSFSIWHWLIVLLVVVVIFGTKKLRNIGSDLGGAVRGFKAVSYTHLRAHETVLDLVCRLLLEKKKPTHASTMHNYQIRTH